jgi:hypothetical protein
MDAQEYRARLHALVSAQRASCLWLLREDLDLSEVEVQRIALEAIQRRGALAAFREAGELKQWLSLQSSATS